MLQPEVISNSSVFSRINPRNFQLRIFAIFFEFHQMPAYTQQCAKET